MEKDNKKGMMINFNPRKVLFFLGSIILFLILANIYVLIAKYKYGYKELYGLIPLFNLNEEKNIPTFYSTITLFISSCLCYFIALACKKQKDKEIYYWIFLAVILLFISIDEFICFHEYINKQLHNSLNTSGLLYFAWVIPYGILVIIICLIYYRFFKNLTAKIKRLFITALVLFVMGAIGIEMIWGAFIEIQIANKATLFAFLTTLEESMEMFGVLILIYALISYINIKYDNPCIRFSSDVENF